MVVRQAHHERSGLGPRPRPFGLSWAAAWRPFGLSVLEGGQRPFSLSVLEGNSWFDRLTTNGLGWARARASCPLGLSLLEGEWWFDRLTTNGLG